MTPTVAPKRPPLTAGFIGIIVFKYLKAAAFLLLGLVALRIATAAPPLGAPRGRPLPGSHRAQPRRAGRLEGRRRADEPPGARDRRGVDPGRSRLRGGGRAPRRAGLVGDLLHDRADGARNPAGDRARSRSGRAACGATCSSRSTSRSWSTSGRGATSFASAASGGRVREPLREPGLDLLGVIAERARLALVDDRARTRRRCRSARASPRRAALAGFSIGSTYERHRVVETLHEVVGDRGRAARVVVGCG